MIISHRHKFIFVHLGRTGGRSLTAALAEHCGPNDVITKVNRDFPARNAAGYARHDSALSIRAKIGESVWNDYFKFAFERNPWEKIVSRYWHYAGLEKKKSYKKVWEKTFGQPMTFRQWFWMKVWTGRLFGLGHIRFPAHYHDYTDRGHIIVDFIGRSENRKEHLSRLSDKLRLKLRDDLRIGAEHHKTRTAYTELFDARMQRIVKAQVFAKNLELLGYRFGEAAPKEPLVFRDGQLISDSTFSCSRMSRAA